MDVEVVEPDEKSVEQRLADPKFAKQWLLARWEEMDRYRRPYKSQWDLNYKMYRSRPDPRDSDWQTNLFIPRTFEIVETIKPRLVQGLFAQDPAFAMLPVPRKDVFLFPDEERRLIDRAKEVELVINAQLGNEIKLRELALREWFSFALIFGIGPVALGWNSEDDTPIVQCLDPYDFWIDPAAKTIEDAWDACYEVRVPLDEVRARARAGIYDQDAVSKLYADTDSGNPADERRRYIGVGTSYTGEQSRLVTIRQHCFRNRLISYTKDGRILRNAPNSVMNNQALPLANIVNIPIPGEFYGLGWPEVLWYLQTELNDLRCLRVDNLKLSICKMYAVSSEINDEMFLAAPGAVFKVQDPQSGFRVIEQGDISQSAYLEENTINQDIDRTAGTYDYTRGQTRRSGETATGINLIQTEANVRFGMQMAVYETGILNLIRKLYIMDQVNLALPRVIRERDENGVRFTHVSQDSFEGTYDVMPVTSSTVGNRDTRRQSMLQLVQTIQQVPEFKEQVDFRRMLVTILQMFDLRDMAGLLKPQEQIEMERQLAQMQQQTEEMGGGPKGIVSSRGVPSPTGVPSPIPGPGGEMKGRQPSMRLA